MTERAKYNINYFKHICRTRELRWQDVVAQTRRETRRHSRRYFSIHMIACYFLACPEEAFAPFMKNDEQ